MPLALFTRRTNARTEPEQSAPTPEDWTPEGTVVVQRYRGLGGAVILVYTANVERFSAYYAAACLGCTYRAASSSTKTHLPEEEAAQLANDHAGTCRAMPRGVPVPGGDAEAEELIYKRLLHLRTYISSRTVHLSDFHTDRVDLQRPTHWIKQQLADIAQHEPDLLAARTDSGGTQFQLQPKPRRADTH